MRRAELVSIQYWARAFLSKPVLTSNVFGRRLWRLLGKVEVLVTSSDINVEGKPAIPLSQITHCVYEYPDDPADPPKPMNSVGLEYLAEDGTRQAVRLWPDQRRYRPDIDAAERLHIAISEAYEAFRTEPVETPLKATFFQKRDPTALLWRIGVDSRWTAYRELGHEAAQWQIDVPENLFLRVLINYRSHYDLDDG